MHDPSLTDEQREFLWKEARRTGMSRRAFLALLGSAGVAAVLAACSPKASPTTTAPATTSAKPGTTAAPAPTEPYGELRMALVSFGEERFTPITTTGVTPMVMFAPLGDWMFWQDKRGGEPLPRIVEKAEMAADGLSWRFQVRKGVKFHNGDDLTGRDVGFTLEQLLRRDAGYADARNMVDKVEVVDDYTVRVITKGKQPLLTGALTLMLPHQGLVIPKNYIEKNGWDNFEKQPIGSGPFRLVRHVPGDRVEYEAVDKHWFKTPAFKKLTLLLVPEEATRMAMLKAGEVDIIENVGYTAAVDAAAAGFQTVPLKSATTMIMLPGAYDPRAKGMPTADIRVRQALSLAINRDEIIKSFYLGKADPPLPPTFSGPDRDMDFSYWLDYTKKAYRYDPAAAAQLLKEAGYANGFNIKLYNFGLIQAPDNPKLAEIIQGYWQKVGVKTDLVPIDLAGYLRIKNKPIAAELVGQASTYGADSVAPANMRTHFNSASGSWMIGDAFPEFDKLVNSYYSETDTAKRKEQMAGMIKIVTDAYTVLSIATTQGLIGLGKKVVFNLVPPQASGNIPVYAALVGHRS
ncbi:MAG: ABC transporter substrate-binding protein [Chloroflexi bacterium]|nr:ABC transporter substrate-binding protein [Chloroflexota bacterium]